jgi:hypothetical protein
MDLFDALGLQPAYQRWRDPIWIFRAGAEKPRREASTADASSLSQKCFSKSSPVAPS